MYDNCAKCPQNCRFKFHVPGSGSTSAPYVIIGEVPGASEVGSRKGLTGKSGTFTWDTLAEYGISREDCYVTNTVKCFMHDPKKEVVNACFPLLDAEIQACVNKKMIICLGEKAFKALFPKAKEGVIKNSGKILHHDGYDCDVLICINPAATMYNSKLVALFRESLARIKRPIAPKPEIVVHFNEGIELIQQMAGRVVAVDVETTGLEIYEPGFAITEIGFYDGTTCAIYDGHYLQQVEFLDAIEQLKILTHNGQFDVQALAKVTGRWFTITHDTLMMGYVKNESFGSGKDDGYALEKLAGIYLSAPPWKAEMKRKGYQASDAEMNEYLGNDVYYTYKLYEKWISSMRPVHYYEVLIPAFNAAARMSAYGVQMDVELCRKMRKRFDKTIALMRKRLQDIVGDPSYNPNSYKQNQKIFEQLTGKPTTITDDDYLAEHLDIKFFRIMRTYRSLFKLASTYLTTKYVSSDGLIHPMVKVHGTETGRISMKKPNMQNVPKAMRRLFIPHEGDSWYLSGDFDQLEIKIACALANLRNFIDKINEGYDIHTVTAMVMTGKTKADYPEDKWSEVRRKAKEVNFGTLYGAGLPKLVKLFTGHEPEKLEPERRITAFKEAQAFVNQHFAQFEEWKRNLIDDSLKKGYVETMYQGRRRFLHIDRRNIEEVKRQIVNTIVQGTAGQLAVQRVVQLVKELPEKFGAHVVNTVHDSIDVTCPDGKEVEVAQYIKQVMEQPVHFTDMKLTASIDIKRRWKEVEPAQKCPKCKKHSMYLLQGKWCCRNMDCLHEVE